MSKSRPPGRFFYSCRFLPWRWAEPREFARVTALHGCKPATAMVILPAIACPPLEMMNMLHRLLLGLLAMVSLTLAGCVHSPQQLSPQPVLNTQLAAVGRGQPVVVRVVANRPCCIR